jgi:hypothetical protein
MGLGFELKQELMLAKQVFYPLSHTSTTKF